jgi:shikimate 5-dehydrogenase
MLCGLLGKTLSHSYSPQIHQLLGNYDYKLFEKQPDEIEECTALQHFNSQKTKKSEVLHKNNTSVFYSVSP